MARKLTINGFKTGINKVLTAKSKTPLAINNSTIDDFCQVDNSTFAAFINAMDSTANFSVPSMDKRDAISGQTFVDGMSALYDE